MSIDGAFRTSGGRVPPGAKNARQLSNLVGATQFLDFAFQRLEALTFRRDHVVALVACRWYRSSSI
jgi:hypothetical protein